MMILLPDGTLLIREGEPFPAVCLRCNHLFDWSTIDPLTEAVPCPECGATNTREAMEEIEFRLIEAAPE